MFRFLLKTVSSKNSILILFFLFLENRMWCPYNCPRDDTETITNHFQRVHSHRIIKNDCYSILTQPSFAHRQFLLNNRTNGTFLSKCNTIGDEKITFSTTCLTAKNPVKYELIFYAQPHGNPTLTRRLQTIEFDEMCDSNHDETILDLRYICEKVGGCGDLKSLGCCFRVVKEEV